MKGIDNTMKQTTQDTGAAAKAAAREERDSRNARVLACARGLVAGNSAFPALQIPSDGSGSADDMALVLCHHGLEDARLEATRKALAWTLAAKPAPRRVVLVEAQEADAGFRLEGLEGVEHVKRSIPEAGKGCWIKEALWTIGAREALKDEKVTKLCFLDADCSFADQGWAGEVSGALENHDLVSPHSHMYYADQPDAAVLGLQPSSGHVIAAKEGGNGLPGLAVAMTRGFFLGRLGGQVPNLCIGSGDVYLWLVSAGKDRYPVNTVTFPHALTSAELQGMRPAPSIGTAGQVAVHRNHGPFGERCYKQRAVLCRACSPATGDCIGYDRDGMPVWKDTPGGRILSKAYPALLELARAKVPTLREARDLYDKLAVEEYGPIDDEHPLVVTCLLRSGGGYDARHVRWLKAQFEAKCKAPFRFVCQSDVKIDGVETIPLESGAKDAPGWWGQVEHYRNIWPEGASVLTCDLDTVVFGEFTPHRCPEGEFFMLREYGNWYRSAWAVWGGGLTYFRGDFSFIPEAYKEDAAAGGQASPVFNSIAPQEFVTSCLRAKGVHPKDIESHFCVSYYQGRVDSILPQAHFAVFPASPKPWEIAPRPYWVPELPKE